jgi:hypothetical protein
LKMLLKILFIYQGASAQTLHLRVSQAQLRYNSSDCPVRHQTVSGAPAEQRLSARNGRLCKVNSAIQNVRVEVRGAPDCPVRHRTVRCHMRIEPPMVDKLQALTAG